MNPKHIPAVLKYGAVAVFVVVILALTYRAGGSAPRAELRALQAIAAQQVKQVKQTEVKQKESVKHANKAADRVFTTIDESYRLRHEVRVSSLPEAAALAPELGSGTKTDSFDTKGCTDRDSAADAAHALMLRNFYNEQRELINGHSRPTL